MSDPHSTSPPGTHSHAHAHAHSPLAHARALSPAAPHASPLRVSSLDPALRVSPDADALAAHSDAELEHALAHAHSPCGEDAHEHSPRSAHSRSATPSLGEIPIPSVEPSSAPPSPMRAASPAASDAPLAAASDAHASAASNAPALAAPVAAPLRVSDAVLRALLPSDPSNVKSLLLPPAFAERAAAHPLHASSVFLFSALDAVSSTSRSKKDALKKGALLLACATALWPAPVRPSSNTRTDALRANPGANASIPGYGVDERAIRAHCKSLHLPSESAHAGSDALVRIDNAVRILAVAIGAGAPDRSGQHVLARLAVERLLELHELHRAAPAADAQPSSAASAAAPLLPPASAAPATPALPRVAPMPGDGSCWFHATQRGLGFVDSTSRVELVAYVHRRTGQRRTRPVDVPVFPTLCARLRSAVESIDDADRALLVRVGLLDGLADPRSGAQAKQAYLAGRRFTHASWGGDLEMLLLSYAHDGALSFLVVSNHGLAECRRVRVCRDARADLGAYTHGHVEVLVYSCALSGAAPSEHVDEHGVASTKQNTNHWNGFLYVDSAGTESAACRTLHSESAEQRAARYSALRACAAAFSAGVLRADQTGKQMRADEQLAKRVQAEDFGEHAEEHSPRAAERASPTSPLQSAARPRAAPFSAPRALSTRAPQLSTRGAPRIPPIPPSGGASRRALFDARAAPAADAQANASASAPSSKRAFHPPAPLLPRVRSTAATWSAPKRQPVLWRVVPPSCERHFVSLMEPMLLAYLQHSSAGELDKCAELVHLILDVPGQALLKVGNSHAAQRRRVTQSLEHHARHVEAATQEIARAEPLQPDAATHARADAPEPPHSAAADAAAAEPAPVPPVVAAYAQAEGQTSAREPLPTRPPTGDSAALAARKDELRLAVRGARTIVSENAPRALSRAVKRLERATSPLESAAALVALRALHPQTAGGALCDLPDNCAPGIVAPDPTAAFALLERRVNNGSAPGPSGLSGSMLALLSTRCSDEAKQGLVLLLKDVLNGAFGGRTQARLLSCTLIPITYPDKPNKVRPIAMGETLVKWAGLYAMSLLEARLPALFPKIQFGVAKPGGSEAAAQITRAALAQSAALHADTITLKTDIRNAFNCVQRDKVWERLLATSDTEPLWRLFHWAYSTPSQLLLYSKNLLAGVLHSAEGVRQGDPLAAFAFALAVQPLYEAAIAQLPSVTAVGVLDDLTFIGPRADVLRAYENLLASMGQLHLELRPDKCAVYIPSSVDADTRALVQQQCAALGLPHDAKLETLGVVIGSAADVRAHCEATRERQSRLFECLEHEDMPVQLAHPLLRLCALPRMSYLARTIHPAELGPSAERFDTRAEQCLLRIMQVDDRALQRSAPRLSVEQFRAQLALPLSEGGAGMRPLARTLHAAYYSSLLGALRDFVQLFPSADVESTELHAQLVECQRELVRRTKPPDVSLKRAHTAAAAARAQSEEPSAAPAASILQAAPVPKSTRAHSAAAASAAAAALPVDPTPFKSSTGAAAAAAQASNGASNISSLPLQRGARVGSAPPAQAETQHVLLDVRAQWASARTPQSRASAVSQHAQRELTQLLEERARDALLAGSTPYMRRLLTSLGAPHASDYLRALPTEAALALDDAACRLAFRSRCGLLPFDSLAGVRCACLGSLRAAAFDADPDHFHSCSTHASLGRQRRHKQLMQALSDLARGCGFIVLQEPNGHLRPLHSSGRALHPGDAKYGEHADLLLIRGAEMILVDVSVTRSTADSYLERGALDAPGATAELRALLKTNKYRATAEANQYELMPLVLETSGALCVSGRALLKKLAAHSAVLSPVAFLQHAHTRLSVALQAGNAHVQLCAMQDHLLSAQRARSRQARPQSAYAHKQDATRFAARVAQAEAEHAQQQRELQQPQQSGASADSAEPTQQLHSPEQLLGSNYSATLACADAPLQQQQRGAQLQQQSATTQQPQRSDAPPRTQPSEDDSDESDSTAAGERSSAAEQPQQSCEFVQQSGGAQRQQPEQLQPDAQPNMQPSTPPSVQLSAHAQQPPLALDPLPLRSFTLRSVRSQPRLRVELRSSSDPRPRTRRRAPQRGSGAAPE